jgi:hypothetical protein
MACNPLYDSRRRRVRHGLYIAGSFPLEPAEHASQMCVPPARLVRVAWPVSRTAPNSHGRYTRPGPPWACVQAKRQSVTALSMLSRPSRASWRPRRPDGACCDHSLHVLLRTQRRQSKHNRLAPEGRAAKANVTHPGVKAWREFGYLGRTGNALCKPAVLIAVDLVCGSGPRVPSVC